MDVSIESFINYCNNTKNMGLRSLMIRKFNINYHPGNANEIMHNLDILVQKSNAYADVARKMSRK